MSSAEMAKIPNNPSSPVNPRPSKKQKPTHSTDPVDSLSAKVTKTLKIPSSPLKNPNPMPSKKQKLRHSADPADSRSAKVAKTPQIPSSPLKNPIPMPSEKQKSDSRSAKTPKPNPSFIPNLNPHPPKSSKKKPNPSTTGSVAKESNPSSQGKLKVQDSNNEDDTLTILSGVIDFRMKNGVNPTPSSIKRFHDDLHGSLHSEISEDKLYNKLRVLRRKFRKIASSGAGRSDHDCTFYELSMKAWETAGEKQKKKTEASGEIFKEHDEEEDQETKDSEGDDSLKYFVHEMREYWKAMKLPESELHLALKSVDRVKAKAVDKKLRDCMEIDMKLRVKRHGLKKELAVALVAASKRL